MAETPELPRAVTRKDLERIAEAIHKSVRDMNKRYAQMAHKFEISNHRMRVFLRVTSKVTPEESRLGKTLRGKRRKP